jgi:hypothetical protein
LLAISAVTELAVERAEQTGLTLVGFCRPGRADIYSGCQRIFLSDGKREGKATVTGLLHGQRGQAKMR